LRISTPWRIRASGLGAKRSPNRRARRCADASRQGAKGRSRRRASERGHRHHPERQQETWYEPGDHGVQLLAGDARDLGGDEPPCTANGPEDSLDALDPIDAGQAVPVEVPRGRRLRMGHPLPSGRVRIHSGRL
jgi:hypothetical protein